MDFQKIIDKALHDYSSSGNGDAGVVEDNCNGTLKSYNGDNVSLDSFVSEKEKKKKGVSMEDSLKVCSSKFFKFVQCNPALFFCYACIIQNSILESYSSVMP